MNIEGKTVAITGAARGIGHATAAALLARGARVVIGDRDVAALEDAVRRLPGRVTGHPLDVSDPESFANFLDRARADGDGRIDVLINNAGVMPVGHYLDQSEQAIRTAVEVNLCGVLTGCRLVLPEMVDRRSGHIVNIASLAGAVPVRSSMSLFLISMPRRRAPVSGVAEAPRERSSTKRDLSFTLSRE